MGKAALIVYLLVYPGNTIRIGEHYFQSLAHSHYCTKITWQHGKVWCKVNPSPPTSQPQKEVISLKGIK